MDTYLDTYLNNVLCLIIGVENFVDLIRLIR